MFDEIAAAIRHHRIAAFEYRLMRELKGGKKPISLHKTRAQAPKPRFLRVIEASSDQRQRIHKGFVAALKRVRPQSYCKFREVLPMRDSSA